MGSRIVWRSDCLNRFGTAGPTTAAEEKEYSGAAALHFLHHLFRHTVVSAHFPELPELFWRCRTHNCSKEQQQVMACCTPFDGFKAWCSLTLKTELCKRLLQVFFLGHSTHAGTVSTISNQNCLNRLERATCLTASGKMP